MSVRLLPAVPRGLCAAVYTQLSDVEDELNGLMTYDRRVVKLDAEDVRELNDRLRKRRQEHEGFAASLT